MVAAVELLCKKEDKFLTIIRKSFNATPSCELTIQNECMYRREKEIETQQLSVGCFSGNRPNAIRAQHIQQIHITQLHKHIQRIEDLIRTYMDTIKQLPLSLLGRAGKGWKEGWIVRPGSSTSDQSVRRPTDQGNKKD